jgi:hypothetical protein
LLITNLRYLSYSVGAYGNGKYDGITLQFVCDDTGMCYHVHFNVERKRQRGANKGAILPGKQFWVKRGRKFFRFWHYTCALPIPARGLTSFHDCMGKLKSIRFQSEIEDGKKLLKDTLRPMSNLAPHKSPTTTRQLPDKNLIIDPDKDVNQTPTEPSLESISTTCKNNYVISKQVSEYTSNPISPIDETKRVQSQTTDEWLAEYEKQWALECDELF